MEVGIVLRVETGFGGTKFSGAASNPVSPPWKCDALQEAPDIVCFHCKKAGHKISECFALKKSKPVKPVSLAVSSPLRPGCSLLAEVFHSPDTQGSDGDVN